MVTYILLLGAKQIYSLWYTKYRHQDRLVELNMPAPKSLQGRLRTAMHTTIFSMMIVMNRKFHIDFSLVMSAMNILKILTNWQENTCTEPLYYNSQCLIIAAKQCYSITAHNCCSHNTSYIACILVDHSCVPIIVIHTLCKFILMTHTAL